LCRRRKKISETCVDNTAKRRPQESAFALRMQRITSGAAGNGLYTTIKYMRGAASIGLGTTPRFFAARVSQLLI
jgi:hypothetical protein